MIIQILKVIKQTSASLLYATGLQTILPKSVAPKSILPKYITPISGIATHQLKPVNYPSFRQHMDHAKTSFVTTKNGATIIFDQQKKVSALIKPPYFDLRGDCRPIRYFLVDQCDKKSTLGLNLQVSFFLSLLQTTAKRALKSFHSKKPTFLPQKPAAVWTTLRLTA